jgi:4-amino-4-deoxy-L-arabinose transferase-like glycosyltransferase
MKFLKRHWFLLVILLFTAGVRLHLADMPLERDEGEYAYAGQRMLSGEPPYKSAYNMKLPGTYAAYAAIMAVFGQTPTGIRIGVMLVNCASIVLVFLLGRRLLDATTGRVAAGSFALLSLSPSVLGLAGHATHFLTLAALGGALLLTSKGGIVNSLKERRGGPARRRVELDDNQNPDTSKARGGNVLLSQSPVILFASGLCMGLSFLMKQHGIFFGLFGGLWLVWVHFMEHRERVLAFRRKVLNPRPDEKGPSFSWKRLGADSGLFAAGFILPYILTCLALWLAGVFPQFWFWTVDYAREYAIAMPLVKGLDVLKLVFGAIVGPNMLLWLLALAGLVMMWTDDRLGAPARAFIVLLGVCAIGAVSVGLYFRGHYFIPLLPTLGVLGGLAASRSLWLIRNDRSIELFLAIPVLIALVIGVPLSVIGNGSAWFGRPDRASYESYSTSLFNETARVGEYLRKIAPPGARIAVIGSEPQIYFLSGRRAATGYIYMYPLMEKQPFALKMQEEMIAEIERAKPGFVVYVGDYFSWLRSESSHARLMDWWQEYQQRELELVDIRKVETLPKGDREMDTLDSKVTNRMPGREGPLLVESQVMIFGRK